jgi:TPP-dependent pyruvate/acetoin dehydrogenase alpha subunit
VDDRFYRSLYRIRRVEEEIARVYPTDKIKSPVHLAIGQEAVSVGVCAALAPGDVVSGTYRGHALYLAKGGDLRRMIAELYAKATGCARGKGGSMHLVDAEAGVLGTSAVVGTTIPIAVGYAYAARVRGRPTVVASVFGDGAVEEGVFHESLNFAALRRVPVLFVCENNFYAIHAPQWTRQSTLDLVGRVRGYGIAAERVESGDVREIHDRAAVAVSAIRAGGGPRFLEILTYRWKEHVGPREDFDAGYRTRGEAEPWFRKDEVARVAARLSADVRAAIEREVEADIRDAFEFAEQSPEPEPAELYTDVFGRP